jgi:hypothetical protein
VPGKSRSNRDFPARSHQSGRLRAWVGVAGRDASGLQIGNAESELVRMREEVEQGSVALWRALWDGGFCSNRNRA